MTSIYVVIARTGNYSDTCERLVRAFASEAEADAWRDGCESNVVRVTALQIPARRWVPLYRRATIQADDARNLCAFDPDLLPDAGPDGILRLPCTGDLPDYSVAGPIPMGAP